MKLQMQNTTADEKNQQLIFHDGDQIYNFQMIITLLSYVLETYKWLR